MAEHMSNPRRVERVNGRLPTLGFGVIWSATVAKTETEAATMLLEESVTTADFISADNNPFFIMPNERKSRFVDLQAIAVALRPGGAIHCIIDGHNVTAFEGAVAHTGDDKTGMGNGWDEVVTINLNTLPEEIDGIALYIHCKSGHLLADAEEGAFAVFSMRDQVPILKGDFNVKTTSCLLGILRRVGADVVLIPVQHPFSTSSCEAALSLIHQHW